MYGYIYMILNKINGKTYIGKHKSHPKKNWSSEVNKGRHWYNNGIDNVFTYECPEGFTLGRSPKVKETLSNSMKGRVPWNKRR